MFLHPSQLAGPIIAAGLACVDIIPEFAPGSVLPQPGKLLAVGPAAIATGGAVPNVGVALAKLGAPVRMVGMIGDDLFGQELRRQLISSGAEVRLAVSPSQSTSYTMVLDLPGVDRSFLHCPGVNDTFHPDADIADDDLRGGITFYFGYPPVMRRTYLDGGSGLARLFARCRAMNIPTALDLCSPDPAVVAAIDWHAWFARVLPAVSMFCPSLDEIRLLLRRPPRADVDDAPELARMFRDMGAATVCLKMGERGLYVQQADQEIWQPCLPAKFVGATGSGDSTVAGLITARLCGYALADAARLACCVGACSVESPTATGSIPSWDQVLKRAGYAFKKPGQL